MQDIKDEIKKRICELYAVDEKDLEEESYTTVDAVIDWTNLKIEQLNKWLEEFYHTQTILSWDSSALYEMFLHFIARKIEECR